METRLLYCYAFIEKATNKCIQTNKTNNGNISINNDEVYTVPVNPDFATEYVGKYYYAAVGATEKTWWKRNWSEVNEYGKPVEGATYIDTSWSVGSEN